MREILIFAGTTEGRKLSELLAASGIRHVISVATEYGEMVLKEHPCVKVLRGRLTQDDMVHLMKESDFSAVVDATHPYAAAVTEIIQSAAEHCGIPYLRLFREEAEAAKENVRYFVSHEACAAALGEVPGNILLTTGSKNLSTYCAEENLKKRLYVRVLPGLESLENCIRNGISGRQILALQGPFSAELNEALISQYQIACLVTKESGVTGGYPEKIEAAKNKGIPVFVIGHEKESGYSFQETCRKLEEVCDIRLPKHSHFHITLAGIGMGDLHGQTVDVAAAIRNADILLGAKRMIDPYTARLEKKPYYRADRIIPYLKEQQERLTGEQQVNVVVLFSGDSGFYSGCPGLYRALENVIKAGELSADLHILPGISSVSYLASCIGESYQDTKILSIHGRKLPNLIKKIPHHTKLFLLMSGAEDLRKLGKELIEFGLDHCEITAGFNLSYPNQNIWKLSPKECCDIAEEGLVTCLIKNSKAHSRRASHGLADTEFLRDKIPMTKEEVREVSICKMQLREDSVVYDVGSGSGSIAIEMAGLSDDMKVYAIERKPEAVALIRKNREKFGLESITVIETEAPDGFAELPAPTHAFIGGSGHRMKEILHALYEKNPGMRIVINAISMESICEIREILETYPIANEQVVQMQVSRAKKAGTYHLMQAENPVWICAFDFAPMEE